MTFGDSKPSFQEVIDFYLRDDVSDALWEMSNRRPLRFYYHTDMDFSKHGAKAKSIGLHCVESCEEFRQLVHDASCRFSGCASPFYAFFGMHARANRPGEREQVIGWDVRFELDLDQASSFEGLIPLAAVLEHLGIRCLLKFSGHRSLHVVVPAEAFPERMRSNAVHREWMGAVDLLGRFLARFAPVLTKTSIGLSKDMLLTAPYSFHRYNGLISLPLTLEEAMEFDPECARLENFSGVAWWPEDMTSQGEEMEHLFDLARRSEREPELALEVAERAFEGDRWIAFVEKSLPAGVGQDRIVKALMGGLVAINHPIEGVPREGEALRRVRRAMARIDDPDVKSVKVLKLAGPVGFGIRRETYLACRQEMCNSMAVWVREGLEGAIQHLVKVASGSNLPAPVGLSVRLLSMLPEEEGELLSALKEEWEREEKVRRVRVFVALGLAELGGRCPEALDLLYVAERSPKLDGLKACLREASEWKVEERPDLAAAALCLVFGSEAVEGWARDVESEEAAEIIGGVFRGNLDKFKHAVRRALRVGTDSSKAPGL